MQRLRILLLGPPAVYYNEQPITIQRRALRALLFYLAHHVNMIDRAQLILAMWPDIDETKGRRRLRETLSKLRSALPAPDLLVTEQDRVGLDRSLVYNDALEFEDLYRQCNRFINNTPRESPLPEPVYQMMEQAVALWRGPRFLAGFKLPESEEFDQWLLETQNQYERNRVRLIERLADHTAVIGDLESAVSWIQRNLSEQPENPDWQYRYLNWLNQSRKHSEALTYCSYLQRLYRDKVGFAPKQLQELWESIRKQAALPDIIEFPSWPPSSLIRTGFVGRQQELQQIEFAHHRGGMVSISGQSGSGKTRLLYEFSQRYTQKERLLVLQARQFNQNIPYQPFVEMLRHAVQPDEWEEMDPAWFAPMVLLMPELSKYLHEASYVHDTYLDARSALLFESLHQVLTSLARKSRLLLFLDDAHWCDKTSLDVMGYLLGRGFFDKNGFLVIASSKEDNSLALNEFFSSIRMSGNRFIEIQLDELSLKEAGELINNVLGQSYDGEIVTRLLQSISGYPLHLLEVLRSVLEYSPSLDTLDMIDRLPLPKSIQELIRRRMSNLSATALKVLQVAAVAGDSFSPALLERAANLDAEQVVRALEDLERLHMVELSDTGGPGIAYRFPYKRVRNAVLADLSVARHRMLHLIIARAMEALPRESQMTALIARHFEAAAELKPGFDYWIKTGEKTSGLYTPSETLEAFHKADRLLHLLGDFVTDDEIYHLYFTWGTVLDINWMVDEAIRVGYALQNLGNRRESPLLLGLAFNNLSRAYRRRDQYEKSLDYSKKALIQLERANHPRELAFGYIRNAIILNLVGEYEEADCSLQKAIQHAGVSNDQRLQTALASAIIQMMTECNFKGLPTRTLELSDLSRQSIYSTIVIPDVDMIEIARAHAYFLLGRYQESYELCEQVLQRALEQKNKRLEAYSNIVLGRAAMMLGMVDECLQRSDTALQISQQYNYRIIMQLTYSVRGDFFHKFEDYSRAYEEHQKGMQISSRLYYQLDNAYRLAHAMIRLGEDEPGLSLLKETIAETEANRFAYVCLPARLSLADWQVNTGEYKAAEENIRRVLIESERRMMHGILNNAKLFMAHLVFSQGKIEMAKQYSLEALAFSKESNYIWLEVPILMLLNRIQEQVGEPAAHYRERIEALKTGVMPHAQQPEIRDRVQKYFDSRLADMY